MKSEDKRNHKLTPLVGYKGRLGKSVYECRCGMIAEGWNIKEATKTHLLDVYGDSQQET